MFLVDTVREMLVSFTADTESEVFMKGLHVTGFKLTVASAAAAAISSLYTAYAWLESRVSSHYCDPFKMDCNEIKFHHDVNVASRAIMTSLFFLCTLGFGAAAFRINKKVTKQA